MTKLFSFHIYKMMRRDKTAVAETILFHTHLDGSINQRLQVNHQLGQVNFDYFGDSGQPSKHNECL